MTNKTEDNFLRLKFGTTGLDPGNYFLICTETLC